MTPQKYDTAPLVAWCWQNYRPATRRRNQPSQMTPMGAAAERLGVPRATLYKWSKGGIPWFAADKVAVSLGVHPVVIWPEWLADEIAISDAA